MGYLKQEMMADGSILVSCDIAEIALIYRCDNPRLDRLVAYAQRLSLCANCNKECQRSELNLLPLNIELIQDDH